MATKVFFYTLRPYDELSIAQRLAPQLDIEFGYTQEYPTLENAELAKGYDEPETVAFVNGVLGGFMRGELGTEIAASAETEE